MKKRTLVVVALLASCGKRDDPGSTTATIAVPFKLSVSLAASKAEMIDREVLYKGRSLTFQQDSSDGVRTNLSETFQTVPEWDEFAGSLEMRRMGVPLGSFPLEAQVCFPSTQLGLPTGQALELSVDGEGHFTQRCKTCYHEKGISDLCN